MKYLATATLVLALLIIPALARADSGVVVESKGQVTITLPGKTAAKPRTGMELPPGTKITAGGDGEATVLFKSGQVYALKPSEKLIIPTDAPGAGNKGVIRGISLALHEMAYTEDEESVHAMVKAPAKPFKLTPSYRRRMEKDLKAVDNMGLSTMTGANLLKAQVYYKYRQYREMLDLLLALYRAEKQPTDTVKRLIALAYIKLGNLEAAQKYLPQGANLAK